MSAFMSREAFAELRLHEKNSYLQRMAEKGMAEKGTGEKGTARKGTGEKGGPARGGEGGPLSKEALSRLRRFYSRRAVSDLKLDAMPPGPMRDALVRMAEAIHGKDVKKALISEIPAGSRGGGEDGGDDGGEGGGFGEDEDGPLLLARVDENEAGQLNFFVPRVHDAPLKDEMNLMDIAPFALSKTRRNGVIRYELKDSVVTIEGGAETGLATAYDYDIFLSMVSYLAEEMRRYRIEEAKGRRPDLPAATYRPAASHILRFCRRGLGGKQYIELENALDRLQATRIKITNLSGGKRRETQSFPMIGRYKVVSRTGQERVETVEIDVPKWVYDGVVRPDGKPSILTLHPDYFLINQPIARFVYRLARKAAGATDAYYTLRDLHYRSGSKLPLAKFRRKVEDIVEKAKTDPLPDYDLALKPGKRDRILYMSRRPAGREDRGGDGER